MFFTGRGDDGYTDLIGGPRVAKDNQRIDALGDLDEASAALGLARASATLQETRTVLLQAQRNLYLLMAELAAIEGRSAGQQRITEDHVESLEATIKRLSEQVTLPREFIAPGDSFAGAALDVARTIVRRAERTVTTLFREGLIANQNALRYLNRLSSLLFGLARMEDAAAGAQPTISKAIEQPPEQQREKEHHEGG